MSDTPAPLNDLQGVPLLPPIADDEPRPFWSVIVPLYNRRQYLQQCLESVFVQDPGVGEMEVLIADDAITDDLSAFVQEVGRGRVIYHRNETQMGLYPSTNAALARARGRWIHILHDDDWVLPGFFGTLRKAVEGVGKNAGVAFTHYTNLDERTQQEWQPEPFTAISSYLDKRFLVRLVQGNPLNLCAVIYRREVFEKTGVFRVDLPYTADWEFYVRSVTRCPWYHVTANLARYRTHHGNQSHDLLQAGRTSSDIRRTIQIFESTLPADFVAEALPTARELQARGFLGTAITCLQSDREVLARHFIKEALELDADACARPEFATLLQLAEFPSLRQELRAYLMTKL